MRPGEKGWKLEVVHVHWVVRLLNHKDEVDEEHTFESEEEADAFANTERPSLPLLKRVRHGGMVGT